MDRATAFNRPIRLGLLDFGWVNPGQSATQTLNDLFAVAKSADELGYTRLWLGEHHLQQHSTGSPHILAGVIAAFTRRVRVGVGAMLLHYWSPLKLAEDFRMLEAIFRRVDLGIGRGRADNWSSHLALLDGRQFANSDAENSGMLDEAAYQARIDDLVNHLRGTIPKEHPHYGAAVIPEIDAMPEIWICGSLTAATQAARTGTRFSCTLFHGRKMLPPECVVRYRMGFRASRELDKPYVSIAVCGTCAETEEDALAVRASFGHRNYLPSVVGAPEQCKAQIVALHEQYEADEVLFLDMAPDRGRRLKSMSLLAQALEVRAQPTDGT